MSRCLSDWDLSWHWLVKLSDMILYLSSVTLISVWASAVNRRASSLMLNALEVVCIDFCPDRLFCLVPHLLIAVWDYSIREGLMELILLTLHFIRPHIGLRHIDLTLTYSPPLQCWVYNPARIFIGLRLSYTMGEISTELYFCQKTYF